jgi:hypothetical protein
MLLIQKQTENAKYFPYFSKYYHQMKQTSDILFEFYRNEVDEHIKRANHDSEPTDFVEAFLREKARRDEANGKENLDPIYKYFLEKNLI